MVGVITAFVSTGIRAHSATTDQKVRKLTTKEVKAARVEAVRASNALTALIQDEAKRLLGLRSYPQQS